MMPPSRCHCGCPVLDVERIPMQVTWLIGRFDGDDAARLAAWVAAAWPRGRRRQFHSPAEALAADGSPPDLMVVVQHRPWEFSPRDAEQLVADQPLAELVVALGVWCGSSMRSERIWPEAVVVPLWSARHRLSLLQDVLAERRSRLPVTAGRDEAVLFDAALFDGTSPATGKSATTVSIVSPDGAVRAMLADQCHLVGVSPLPCGSVTTGSVVLLDVTTERWTRLRSDVATIRRRNPNGRLIALAAVPSEAEIAALRRLGVDAVLPKPFSLVAFRDAIGAE